MIYQVIISIWLMTIYLGDNDIKVGIYIAIGGVLIFFLLFYLYKNALQNGLYIEGDSIYYKYIMKFKINPQKIKGIKITKDTMSKGNYTGHACKVPRVDENGNYVYCMIFLKKLYDDMRTYNVHEEIFCMEYHECIMFKTVYDLPAINRLRELIPDLVVMYEE